MRIFRYGSVSHCHLKRNDLPVGRRIDEEISGLRCVAHTKQRLRNTQRSILVRQYPGHEEMNNNYLILNIKNQQVYGRLFGH